MLNVLSTPVHVVDLPEEHLKRKHSLFAPEPCLIESSEAIGAQAEVVAVKKMIAALKSRRGVRVSPKEQGAISVFHTMSCREWRDPPAPFFATGLWPQKLPDKSKTLIRLFQVNPDKRALIMGKGGFASLLGSVGKAGEGSGGVHAGHRGDDRGRRQRVAGDVAGRVQGHLERQASAKGRRSPKKEERDGGEPKPEPKPIRAPKGAAVPTKWTKGGGSSKKSLRAGDEEEVPLLLLPPLFGQLGAANHLLADGAGQRSEDGKAYLRKQKKESGHSHSPDQIGKQAKRP